MELFYVGLVAGGIVGFVSGVALVAKAWEKYEDRRREIQQRTNS